MGGMIAMALGAFCGSFVSFVLIGIFSPSSLTTGRGLPLLLLISSVFLLLAVLCEQFSRLDTTSRAAGQPVVALRRWQLQDDGTTCA